MYYKDVLNVSELNKEQPHMSEKLKDGGITKRKANLDNSGFKNTNGTNSLICPSNDIIKET